jgi:hypothetical protein
MKEQKITIILKLNGEQSNLLLEKEMYSAWTHTLKFYNFILLVITLVLIFSALSEFKY